MQNPYESPVESPSDLAREETPVSFTSSEALRFVAVIVCATTLCNMLGFFWAMQLVLQPTAWEWFWEGNLVFVLSTGCGCGVVGSLLNIVIALHLPPRSSSTFAISAGTLWVSTTSVLFYGWVGMVSGV
jgi:hypothetical protein